MAATSSFYNDNLYRAYPFIAGQAGDFPTHRLAGIRVCCLYSAAFTSFPSVYLTTWEVFGGSHFLTFLCTDGITDVYTQLKIPSNTEPFSRITPQASDPYHDGPADVEISIIVGRLDKETTSFGLLKLQIEPVCIIWLRHRGISEIAVCNQARYRLETDSEGQALTYYPDGKWWIQPPDAGTNQDSVTERIQDKPLIFSEGWNCGLTLSQTETKISFNAAAGAGLGEVSEDVPRGYIMGVPKPDPVENEDGELIEIPQEEWTGDPQPLPEAVPAPSLRFDGLPDYQSVTYSFCGAEGPDVGVQAGENILVRADQSAFTIFIGVSKLGGDSC
jgi:hypothetical protein